MKIIITVLALIFSFACSADPIVRMRTEPKRTPLKGRVKVVRFYNYAAEELNEAEIIELRKNDYSVDSFDEAGRKIYSYSVPKSVLGGTRYNYDTKGKIVEQHNETTDSNKILRTVYEYDTSGQLIQELLQYSGEYLVYRRKSYTYLSGLLVNKVDSIGQRIAYTHYEYNDKRQLIKETRHFTGSEELVIRYTYYENGNILSEASGECKTIYTYDGHNNEVLAKELCIFDTTGKERSFSTEYIYDSHGNWVRLIENSPEDYAPQPGRHMFIREIEYY